MSDETKPKPALPYHLSLLSRLHRRREQPAHRAGRVSLAEDGRAGDEDFRARRGARGDVVPVNAAVNLDAGSQAALLDHAAQAPDLLDRCRDEPLAAEAGVDRHD